MEKMLKFEELWVNFADKLKIKNSDLKKMGETLVSTWCGFDFDFKDVIILKQIIHITDGIWEDCCNLYSISDTEARDWLVK